MNAQIERDISVLEMICRAGERMRAELMVHRGEVEITATAVEECLSSPRTEAASAAVASAVAVALDAVQCLDKDLLVNIKKLHAPSAGMTDTFNVI
jgi:hypothetical protein